MTMGSNSLMYDASMARSEDLPNVDDSDDDDDDVESFPDDADLELDTDENRELCEHTFGLSKIESKILKQILDH